MSCPLVVSELPQGELRSATSWANGCKCSISGKSLSCFRGSTKDAHVRYIAQLPLPQSLQLINKVHLYFERMSTLLENVIAIIDLFQQYSKTDKETDTLSKEELKELLEIELGPILKNPDDPDTAEVFMDILDIDHNQKLDFEEFFLMVFKLAKAYYHSKRRPNFQASGQKQKKKEHQKKPRDKQAHIMPRHPPRDTTPHPMGSQDRAQEEDHNPSMSSHLTAADTRALDTDHRPRDPGQPDKGAPVAVRPATAKDSLHIQVDNLAQPMTGLDPVPHTTMGLPMTSPDTVLDTLVPIEGSKPSMGTLTTPRDTQTLMPEEDRDLVMDGLQTPPDNQARIMPRHPPRDTTPHPMGSQDRAQEEDHNPSMSSHLTAADTRALDTDHRPRDPGQPDKGAPVAVRPATAKDSLHIQVDNLAQPMTGLDPVPHTTMGLPMTSPDTVLDTLVPIEGSKPSMGTLTTPRDTQTLMPEEDRDLVMDGLQTPPDNQARIMPRHPPRDTTPHPMGSQDRAQEEDHNPSMSSHLTAADTRALDTDHRPRDPGQPDKGAPVAVRPATAKDSLHIQVDNLAQPMTGLDPVPHTTMGLPMTSPDTVLDTLVPIEGSKPSMGTLTTPRDTQTLMPEEDRDLVMDGLQTPPDNQARIMPRHPPRDTTPHPMGSQDRAQEEDHNPSMSSHLTAADTRALDTDHRPRDPGQPDKGAPVAVRPATAKDSLHIQVDNLAQPMTGLDPVPHTTMGLPMTSPDTVLDTLVPIEGSKPSMGTLTTPRDTQTLMPEEDRDLVMDGLQTPPDNQARIMPRHPPRDTTPHPMGSQDRAQEEDHNPSMSSHLTAADTRALDTDHRPRDPGQPDKGAPVAVRPATAKDSLHIQVDNLAQPMTGLDPVPHTTMGLPMTSPDTVLDTLVPIEGSKPSMGTLTTPRDTQTLMPEEDRDLVMDGLQTPPDNQARIMPRHPPRDTTPHPMGSQDRAQEEDHNPSMSSHLTAADTRALDTDHRPRDPGQPDKGAPVAVRPATAKDSLHIQVDNLAQPMTGLDPVPHTTMGLPMTSPDTVLDTLVPIEGSKPSMGTLTTPRDTQTLMPEEDRDLVMDGLQTPPDNQARIMPRHPPRDTTPHPMGSQDRAQEEDHNPSMSSHLTAADTRALDTDHRPRDPGQPDKGAPVAVRPATAKDSLHIQVDNLAQPMTGLDPVPHTTMGLPMTSQDTVLDTLVPIEGSKPSMGTLTTPRDTQTLMPEEDRDLVMDGLQTPPDNQARIMPRHPPRDTTPHPMGSQDRAQEEDHNPSMSSHLTAADTRALDTDHRPRDPGQPDKGAPVAVRPATAKIQVDHPPRPVWGVDPVQRFRMHPPMDNQEIALGTRGLLKGKQPPTGSPYLPMGCQEQAVHIDRDTTLNRQQIASETLGMYMEIFHLILVTVDTME
ncbi:Filaggrin [Myotis davidii]|uniref:Filaggrin n=1 Tax=Myotis davidii TaxID=225400 RepID=L5MD08_MYODS|nr:Filaggrin [Myotis davidii]